MRILTPTTAVGAAGMCALILLAWQHAGPTILLAAGVLVAAAGAAGTLIAVVRHLQLVVARWRWNREPIPDLQPTPADAGDDLFALALAVDRPRCGPDCPAHRRVQAMSAQQIEVVFTDLIYAGWRGRSR